MPDLFAAARLLTMQRQFVSQSDHRTQQPIGRQELLRRRKAQRTRVTTCGHTTLKHLQSNQIVRQQTRPDESQHSAASVRILRSSSRRDEAVVPSSRVVRLFATAARGLGGRRVCHDFSSLSFLAKVP